MVTATVCTECLTECYRDIKKKSKNDPEYDPKTLYVPDSFSKQQTPVSVQ